MPDRAPLRFGISLPEAMSEDEANPTPVFDYVARAESLGFDSAWTTSQGAIPSMAFAAAASVRLKLGTSVMIPTVNSPIHLARDLATVDRLSGGRLIWGVGLGGAEGYSAFGITTADRVARFEECITLVKRLWSEEHVTFEGRFWQIHDTALVTRPVQSPGPPIWFGAHSPSALRRALRLGDGWMGAGHSTLEEFKGQMVLIRQYLEEDGRDPRTFPLAKRAYIAVDRDKKRASERMVQYDRRLHGIRAGDSATGVRDRALAVGVYGSVEECIDTLGEMVSTGIELLLLHPVFDVSEQMELLAKEVCPRLS